ncbi:MAG: glycosyltransferase [Actinomycetota bacterium]|nr:glycosyltransferase [Actinomycetota bacterium]
MRTPIALIHLDLAVDSADRHYEAVTGQVKPGQGVRLVLWRHDLPLGEVHLTAQGWPVSKPRFRQLLAQAIAPAVGQRLFGTGFDPALPERRSSREPSPAPVASTLTRLVSPLQGLAEPAGFRPGHSALRVSVIVCTRDRPEQLRRALAAVKALRPAPDQVLVVDNASASSATREVVDSYPEVGYVHEPRPGLSVARNRGLRETSGEVVAFTDDDAEVRPNWLAGLLAGFDAPEVMAVTGLVLPAALDTEGQLLFENHLGGFGQGYRRQLFDSAFYRGMRRYGVPVWRIGAGASMAVRRQAFDLVGGFDERLGAGAAGCSEDSEFWYRLLAQGWHCRYEPAAVAVHHHRADRHEVRRQAQAYLRGHVVALFAQHVRCQDPGNVRRAYVGLPRFYLGRLAQAAFVSDDTVTAEIRGFLGGLVSGTLALPSMIRAGSLAPRRKFLSGNPFPHPYTEGFYFRDKMRAIHRVAPYGPLHRILEVGGGTSGVSALLYPEAHVVTADLEPGHGAMAASTERAQFLCADATRLPFADGVFDAVTFFDVLEHIPDDAAAVREAIRVLVPGGVILVTAPNEHWRFPYYAVAAPICPTDEDVMAEWGHVRRGYALSELDRLVGSAALRWATFINPVTVLNHDLAFSRLPSRVRRGLLSILSPVSWLGYAVHRPHWPGTETAAVWRTPAAPRTQASVDRKPPVLEQTMGAGGGRAI